VCGGVSIKRRIKFRLMDVSYVYVKGLWGGGKILLIFRGCKYFLIIKVNICRAKETVKGAGGCLIVGWAVLSLW